MTEFEKSIWAEYPIPKQVSIWGDSGEEDCDFKSLVKTCVRELQSDLYVTDYMKATSNMVQMPSDTIGIISCQYDLPTQGNTYVKKTFIKAKSLLMLRYFPCHVTFRRKLHVEDIDLLEGDRYVYFKTYVLNKMVTKELVQITSVDLSVDTGDVNVDDLRKFQSSCESKLDSLKENVLIYLNS